MDALGDHRRGRAGRTGRVPVAGGLFPGDRVPHAVPGNCQGGGRPGGGGHGVREPDFSRAIEYHTQCLAIAKEVGDRAGEGTAYGSLGNAYKSLGDFSRAIEYHTQRLEIAKEVGDRAGEGGAYGSLGNAYRSLGTFPGRSSTTRSA
jgi:hypothetical protein